MIPADKIATMTLDELREAVTPLVGFAGIYWWQVFELLDGWSLQRRHGLPWRVWRVDGNGEDHVIAEATNPQSAVLRAYLMVTCYLPPTYGGQPAVSSDQHTEQENDR